LSVGSAKKFSLKLDNAKNGYIDIILMAINFDTSKNTPPSFDANTLLFGGKYN